MMVLLAVRAVDVAIFATLGLLWIFGALFIVALYRWILRYERSDRSPPDAYAVTAEPAPSKPRANPGLHPSSSQA